jgi:Rne/Rng family ribonuclease
MGKQRLIVSERDNFAALFDESGHAIEFYSHRGDILLGDVFLTTVENILPSIDAAFVNVGSEKMGFLHASDAPGGKGELTKRLTPKQQLVVQVMKEPTGHKGPRVTSNISLPGRFLVLMPQSRGISISRKIVEASERGRLKSLVSLNKPPGVGVIIRTEAEHQKESDLKEDLETLMERWQNIVSMSESSKPPSLLYRDQDLLYKVIREGVSDEVSEIVVDTPFGHQRAQQLLQNWNLDKNIKATLHSGTQSIMLALGVDREVKQALQSRVPLPSGGYLFIQPTEALCVIDVNSGKFTSMASQAQTIKHTNLEACKEIARQMRLRNVGGMIVVDFIDMESRADQLEVLEAFEKALLPDKAKPQVGQITDLGLVEMTRHRQGQALSEIFTRKCTSCHGSGHALEEMNWAPPGVDTPFRPGQRPGQSRSRLPIRQSNNQAPISPGQPGGNQQGGRQPGGNQPGGRQGGFQGRGGQQQGSRQQGAQPQLGQAAASLGASPAILQVKPKTDTWRRFETFIRQSKLKAQYQKILDDSQSLFANHQKQPVPTTVKSILFRESMTLEDSLKEALNLVLGGHFLSGLVKFSYPPPLANNTLARINPRSNNVQTLVEVLESAVELPADDDGDDDDGSNGDGMYDDDEPQDNTGGDVPTGVGAGGRPGYNVQNQGPNARQGGNPMGGGYQGRPMQPMGQPLGQPMGPGSYGPGPRPMVPHARPVLPVGPSRSLGAPGQIPGLPSGMPAAGPGQPLISVVAPPPGAPTIGPSIPAASVPVASLFSSPALPPMGEPPMPADFDSETVSDSLNFDSEATSLDGPAGDLANVDGDAPSDEAEGAADAEAPAAKRKPGGRPARGSSKPSTARGRRGGRPAAKKPPAGDA